MAPGTARYAAREAMVAATRPLPPTERAAGSSVPPLSPFKLLERAVVEIARQAKDAGQHTVPGELAVLTVLTQALRRGEPVDITVGVSSGTGSGKVTFSGKWNARGQANEGLQPPD